MMIDFNLLTPNTGFMAVAKIADERYGFSEGRDAALSTLTFNQDGSLTLSSAGHTNVYTDIKDINMGIGRTLMSSWVQNTYWTLVQVTKSDGERIIFAIRSLRLFLGLVSWVKALPQPTFTFENDFGEAVYTEAPDYRTLETILNQDLTASYNKVYEAKGYPEFLPVIFSLSRV
jgi:hypothetical protein